MRWKIILVNGGIVLVLSIVTFFLLRSSLATVVANPKAQRAEVVRAVHAADARLTLDSLMAERWLDREAAKEDVRNVFEAGTAEARSDSATSRANQLRDKAVASPEFTRIAPSLVLFVNAKGVGVGRNGSELMRGDKVAEAYPSLAQSLESGNTASALWVNEARQEQLIASYAPVRDDSGNVQGAIIIGTPLNDERMSRTSEVTSGHPVAIIAGKGNTPLASGGPKVGGFATDPVKQAIAGARGGALTHAQAVISGRLYAAAPLTAFSESNAVVVGAAPASLVESIDTLLWPVFAVGILGLFLVITGGVLLGNYISKPIAEVEEGLLLVINGQQDLRFDLEHDELGGLTSRINGLLNSLLGVPENDESSSS